MSEERKKAFGRAARTREIGENLEAILTRMKSKKKFLATPPIPTPRDSAIAQLTEVAKMVDAWGHGIRHHTAHESSMVKTARAALAALTAAPAESSKTECGRKDGLTATLAALIAIAQEWVEAVEYDTSWDSWSQHFKKMKYVVLPNARTFLAAPAPSDQSDAGRNAALRECAAIIEGKPAPDKSRYWPQWEGAPKHYSHPVSKFAVHMAGVIRALTAAPVETVVRNAVIEEPVKIGTTGTLRCRVIEMNGICPGEVTVVVEDSSYAGTVVSVPPSLIIRALAAAPAEKDSQ